MSNITKTVLGIALVGAILGTAAFFGFSSTGKEVVNQALGSAAGTTFNTARFAATTINTAVVGQNGTSTSMLNGDTSDRYVSDFSIGCENVGSSFTANSGAGLATWQLSVGTTSSASPAALVSFANVAKSFVLATSTVDLLNVGTVSSSSNQTATSSFAAVWPSGAYMTFFFNATNTAACTIGVHYFGS